ncbi:MAG: arsenate reductase family protein [Angelakisella sp.]|jgi:arsenate reductase|nr:arsenate reductase family protein [Angelakisella sp.]
MLTLIEYPKCTTCQKARKWLEAQGVEFQSRHILEENPKKEELAAWAEKLPLKRLWNTSGQKYRQLGLAQKLPEMSLEEQLVLLATDGMLVKRPVLVGEGFVLTGFREAEWSAALAGEDR